MIPHRELPIPQPSPETRKTRSWIWILLGVFILLGSGATMKWWQDEQAARLLGQVRVYEGGSEHWDQSEVPISMQCGACHPQQFREWAGSDHAWAFRKLNPQLDAEAFHGKKLKAHHSTMSFDSTADGARVMSDEQSGKKWTVAWATGRTPLVQYLLPDGHGGYHTPSASWDVLKREWFDMFNGEERDMSDWGHWLGRGMNWNSQCAWCHMSKFQKNYDVAQHTYHSEWKEPGVSCIQCHGDLLEKPEEGTGCMVSTKLKATPRQVQDNCASCHSRRDEMDHDFKMGDKFDDHFQLVLPTQQGIFWPNGMQRDEDYCETGLRLSRMGQGGVSCIDCHQAHTGKLKLPQEDNALCMRCHATGELVYSVKAPVIVPAEHTPCPPTSKGGRCVSCHMPESNYMARDPRRDHSFNAPDPQLSVELGIPNACTMCHQDRTDEWAAAEVLKYYGKNPKMERNRPRTRAIQAAYEMQASARMDLLALLAQEENGYWRATMLSLLDSWAMSPDVFAQAQKSLFDGNALARVAAARIVGRHNPELLRPSLQDPRRVVRHQAQWSMHPLLSSQSLAYQELFAVAKHQADQPTGAMKLAQMYSAKGEIDKAEGWYLKACEWDASSPVVHRDYAVFLASQGRNEDAVKSMMASVKLNPQDAQLWYLLALSLVETNQIPAALKGFDQALVLDPQHLRARYNRALLLQKMNRIQEALADLDLCSQQDTQSADYDYLKAIIYLNGRNPAWANRALQEALRRDPQHEPSRQLLRDIKQ